MRTLIFASGNAHKLVEVSILLQGIAQIQGLRQMGFSGDLPEEHDSLEANALQKAREVYRLYGRDCFADDTGLEVYALDMAPGVYSARYAGVEHDDEANVQKLLKELEGQEDRRARFRSLIALILDGREYLFEGVVQGQILREKRGAFGFGYDPVFLPDGYDKTFAEMPLTEKNAISHRYRALQKMKQFLTKQLG